MSVNSFLTSIAQTSGQSIVAGKVVNAPGTAQAQALQFMDLFLSNLLAQPQNPSQTAQALPGETKKAEILQSDNPLLDKTPGLDIAKILGLTPQIEEDSEALANALPEAETPQDQITQTLALNQEAFDKILKPVLAPAEETQTLSTGKTLVLKSNPATIIGTALHEQTIDRSTLYAKIKALISSLSAPGNTPSEDGIISGINSPKIAKLVNKILKLMNSGSPDLTTDSGPLAGLSEKDLEELKALYEALNRQAASILPPPALTPQDTPPEAHQSVTQNTAPAAGSDNLQAANKTSPQDYLQSATDNGAKNNLPGQNTGDAPDETQKSQLDKKASAPDFSANKSQATANGTSKAANPASHTVPQFLTAGTSGSFPIDLDWSHGFYDGMGFHIGANGPVIGNAAAGGTMMGSSGSILPHPAVQMVAATLQKATTQGENKTLTLQLDPPELGKVEVRLTFEKDKSVKALMISEKPETHALLQRDSHFLERALQGAGLDADGSSLSFQMADDGHQFGHNGGHDGHGGNGNNSNNNGPEIIETTMSWYVDPATGHMRYDILA